MVTRDDDKWRHLTLRLPSLFQIPQPDIVIRSGEDMSSRRKSGDGRHGAGRGGKTKGLHGGGERGGVSNVVNVDDGRTATNVDLLTID